jgi:hypothetical protein
LGSLANPPRSQRAAIRALDVQSLKAAVYNRIAQGYCSRSDDKNVIEFRFYLLLAAAEEPS